MKKIMEQIKKAAFEDELQKIAVKNQVAAVAIKGGTMGAGIGGLTSGLTVHQILNLAKSKMPERSSVIARFSGPAKAVSILAGAVGGAEIGGRIGAFIGGGIKGTAGLEGHV